LFFFFLFLVFLRVLRAFVVNPDRTYVIQSCPPGKYQGCE